MQQRLRIIVNDGRSSQLKPEFDRGMPGIDSALLGLAPALARRGHEVHLFGQCQCPGRYGELSFHDRSELADFGRASPADVLVLIPDVLPLLMPLRARARIVWTGNGYTTGDCALTAKWQWKFGRGGTHARLYTMSLLHPYVDKLILNSPWQADFMSGHLGIPRDKLTIAYLGVPLEFYGRAAAARHRHRLIYTSAIRYGLDQLLRLFSQVRAEVPDAELHIFGYEHGTSGTPAELPGAVQPGVFWRGKAKKSALAAELQSAALMAYPCCVKETFSLAVAEAQAAGLPVVTSDRAALSDRVTDGVDGFLIPRRPGNPEYDAAFLDAVLRLLREDELWTRMGAEAANKARRMYDWDIIAARWEDELQQLVAGREPLLPRLEPPPELLNPAWLTVEDRGASAQVPATLATKRLRKKWASYGFDPALIPGLPTQL